MSPITSVFDLLEANGVRILELDVTGSLDGLSGLVQAVPVVLLKRNVPGALAEGATSLSKASVLSRTPIGKLQRDTVN